MQIIMRQKKSQRPRKKPKKRERAENQSWHPDAAVSSSASGFKLPPRRFTEQMRRGAIGAWERADGNEELQEAEAKLTR